MTADGENTADLGACDLLVATTKQNIFSPTRSELETGCRCNRTAIFQLHEHIPGDRLYDATVVCVASMPMCSFYAAHCSGRSLLCNLLYTKLRPALAANQNSLIFVLL